MPSRAVLSKVILNYSDRQRDWALARMLRKFGHDAYTDEALRAFASQLGKDRRSHNEFNSRHRAVRVSEAAE